MSKDDKQSKSPLKFQIKFGNKKITTNDNLYEENGKVNRNSVIKNFSKENIKPKIYDTTNIIKMQKSKKSNHIQINDFSPRINQKCNLAKLNGNIDHNKDIITSGRTDDIELNHQKIENKSNSSNINLNIIKKNNTNIIEKNYPLTFKKGIVKEDFAMTDSVGIDKTNIKTNLIFSKSPTEKSKINKVSSKYDVEKSYEERYEKEIYFNNNSSDQRNLENKKDQEFLLQTRTEYTKSIVRSIPSPCPQMSSTYNTNNFYKPKVNILKNNENNVDKDNLENFNVEQDIDIQNYFREQKELIKLINDTKILLKEGISNSKNLTEYYNKNPNPNFPYKLSENKETINVSNLNTNNSKNKIGNFNDNINSNKKNYQNFYTNLNNFHIENGIINSKKVETIFRFCNLIDNLTSEINTLKSEKNKKKLEALSNINNSKINENDENNNRFNKTYNPSTSNFYPQSNYLSYKTEKHLNSTNKSSNERSFSPIIPSSIFHRYMNLNQIKKFSHLDLKNNIGIEDDNSTHLYLDSFKRKSIYNSLFKNCKNTLNEIIMIYKSMSKEDNNNLKMNESNSSIVNNLTNNINFNFNFNIPKYNINSKSHECKNNSNNINIKKEKSFLKNKNYNNNTKNSPADNSSVIIKTQKSLNQSLDNDNKNDFNQCNLENKENKKNLENVQKLKNSDFTDFSIFDEINESKEGLKISSFNNFPKHFLNYKVNKIADSFKNNNNPVNLLMIKNSKKRSKSLDYHLEELNTILNTNLNLSKKMILINSSHNENILNTLVNDENTSSIKLPISKIRNVTLENYNKNTKIFVAKFVNLNSKNLFKRISTNSNTQKEKEFDMDISISNLNNSYEFDPANSKKLFSSCFRKESKLSKINLKQKIQNTELFNNEDIKDKEKIKLTDNPYFFHKLTETNIIKNIEEEDYNSDICDSFENCNLDVTDDDEKNILNVIKFRSKKMMQKFLFNNNKKTKNILNSSKKEKSVNYYFANKKDSNNSLNKDIILNSNFIVDGMKNKHSSNICEKSSLDIFGVESQVQILNLSSFKICNENANLKNNWNTDCTQNNCIVDKNDVNIEMKNAKSSSFDKNNKNFDILNYQGKYKNYPSSVKENIIDNYNIEELTKNYEKLIAKDEYKNEIGILLSNKISNKIDKN